MLSALVLLLAANAQARVWDFAAAGAVANDPSLATCFANTVVLNVTLAALQPVSHRHVVCIILILFILSFRMREVF
jgi:hypothetical protein